MDDVGKGSIKGKLKQTDGKGGVAILNLSFFSLS